MHSIEKNRTVSWGLLSDLLLNVSPSFSRYNKVFCPPYCLFCSRGRIEFCRGGRKICPSLPPLQIFSAPAKINPAHAMDSFMGSIMGSLIGSIIGRIMGSLMGSIVGSIMDRIMERKDAPQSSKSRNVISTNWHMYKNILLNVSLYLF